MSIMSRRYFRGFLMLLITGVFLGTRPAIEAQANVQTNIYMHENVKYEYSLPENDGKRAVIYKVTVPDTIRHLTVPGTINGVPVVAIGTKYGVAGAFTTCTNLTSIELPDSVCEIYGDSFKGLYRLESLSLNGAGIAIGHNVFAGCSKLQVIFRGTGPVKYVSGYAFGAGSSANHLDFNLLKTRVDKDSWIGYDESWNNEAEWTALVNSLTPFSLSAANSDTDWEPDFEVLDASNGYPDEEQVTENSVSTSTHKAWIRKSAKWLDSSKEQALIRLDVAYNRLSSRQSNDVVFVLDASGSMYYSYNLIPGSNYSRQFQTYDNTRAVAKALLDLNEGGTVYNRVGVTIFGSALRDSTRNAGSKAPEGFFVNYAQFIKWLDQKNYLLAQGTGYSYGLDEAAAIFQDRSDKSRVPSVLFLSDGAPNEGTQGTFPNSTYFGYGGYATTRLSNLGVTRYSILLGDKSADTLEAVTYIAGEPGKSNDRSKTFASPDSATLQQAFKDILVQVANNMAFNVVDIAGNTFDVNELAFIVGGSAVMSGARTDWDLDGTNSCEVYTLSIVQDLKRDSSKDNAFYEGEMETNLGDAVIQAASLGTILGVPSPKLEKTLKTFKVRVHVEGGYAIAKDGSRHKEIEEIVKESAFYIARYIPNPNTSAVLQSVSISTDGGVSNLYINIDDENNKEFYKINDIHCDYDVYVIYKYSPSAEGTWSLITEVDNGTITDSEENIPLPEETRRFVSYAPEEGYHLDSIRIDDALLSLSDLARFADGYLFNETVPGTIHKIYVKYIKNKEVEREEIWGDYRR